MGISTTTLLIIIVMLLANIVGHTGLSGQYYYYVMVFSFMAHIFVIGSLIYFRQLKNTSKKDRLLVGLVSVDFLALSFVNLPEVVIPISSVGVILSFFVLIMRWRTGELR